MERREASGITTRLIVDLVRKRRGDEGVAELLALAGETRPVEVLENPLVWSSCEQRTRLFAAGTVVTDDPDFAFEAGVSVMSSKTAALVRALLGRFGSPSGLLRALPIAHAKFDTAYRSKLVEQRDGYARISFVAKEGYAHSTYDCRYVMGLLSQVPVLFGESAAVVHELQCQGDGAPSCEMEVTWEAARRHRRRRLRRVADAPKVPEVPGRAPVSTPVELLEAQLKDMQATLADLMETSGVGDVLERVTGHAGLVVAAQQLLLAVKLEPDGPLHVHAEGIMPDTARRLGEAAIGAGRPMLEELFSGDSPESEPREILVADVASPLRDYGRLVAFSSAPFVDSEQLLLDSYARLAATALDASTALGIAASRRRTAELLGNFAARLIREQDTSGIASATVEAALEVMGSDRASLMSYDEATGVFRMEAMTGRGSVHDDQLRQLVLGPEKRPDIAATLEALDGPRIRDRDTVEPERFAMLADFNVQKVAMMPVRAHDRLFGVLFTSWSPGRTVPDLEELVRLLNGIADQAAGAWEKALLLEQVHRQASIDSLTGLANRRIFTELLAARLHATDPDAKPVAVLFCDLDRFKGVNDVLGHAAGDELLVEVGRRLAACVRSDDLVARLGGDEFTVLLRDVDDEWSPRAFAAKVREAMAAPISIEGSEVVVHLSIGAVVAAPGSATVKEVLREADAAMYAAKSRGGDRLLTFEENMLLERSERLDLEASLAAAAYEPEQWHVLYQPQVEIATGRVVGAEALLRWRHPERGLLTPDRFLPVAEETGIVIPLDQHVLRCALREAAQWRDLPGTDSDLRVAVNFSVRTLQSAGLVEMVQRSLEEAGVPGSCLEIELTESSAVADPDSLGGILRSLAELGVTIAIDDVGTGYSSLALLHKLPAQRLKIDRSFVQRIPEDSSSRSVVEAVLLLADRLGQSVVAEGIETAEQARQLIELGCRFGQGYLFARPVEAEELRGMIQP
jgi:diguanylate cyclase (GGDEF)-like protein